MSDVTGKSVLDLLWEHLDDFVDAVQEPVNEEEADLSKGRAHGMAVAIALVTNPYDPDVDEVKAQAMERWADRSEVDSAPMDRSAARRARRAARRGRNG